MSIYPATSSAFNMCGLCHTNLSSIGLSKPCASCEMKISYVKQLTDSQKEVAKHNELESESRRLVTIYICDCCNNVHNSDEREECKVCTNLACPSCLYCSYECCKDSILNMRLVILKENVRQIELELDNRKAIEETEDEDEYSEDPETPENSEVDDKEFDVKKEIKSIQSTMGTLFHMFLALNGDDEFKEMVKKIANCDDNAEQLPEPKGKKKTETKVEHSDLCPCAQCILKKCINEDEKKRVARRDKGLDSCGDSDSDSDSDSD